MSSRCNDLRGILFFCLVLPACSKLRQETSPSDAASGAHSSDIPFASVKRNAPETRAPIDLVLRAAALVVTSSHRDESGLAEFMLDGLDSTAWHPNPPDPMPWIDVYFPFEIELTSLTLKLVGRSRSAKPVLIGLTIDGKEVEQVPLTGEHLQLSNRTKARVVRVTFQHQKDRDALIVSSLKLWGHAPVREAWSEMVPESHVQGRSSVAGGRECVQDSPFNSPEAACDSCIAQLKELGSAPYQDIECDIGVPLQIEGKRPQTVREVRWVEITYADELDSYRDSFLALSMSGGWHLSALSSETRIDIGSCPGMSDRGHERPSLAWREGMLTAEQVRWFYRGRLANSPENSASPTSAVRALRVCRTQEELLCREYVIALGYPEANFNDPMQPLGDPVTGPPRKWVWERGYEIRPGGTLRFSPCRDGQQTPRSRVPCFAPGFSTFL